MYCKRVWLYVYFSVNIKIIIFNDVKCFIDFYCNDGIIKKNYKKKISIMIYKSYVYVILWFSDIDFEVNFDFCYV